MLVQRNGGYSSQQFNANVMPVKGGVLTQPGKQFAAVLPEMTIDQIELRQGGEEAFKQYMNKVAGECLDEDHGCGQQDGKEQMRQDDAMAGSNAYADVGTIHLVFLPVCIRNFLIVKTFWGEHRCSAFQFTAGQSALRIYALRQDVIPIFRGF